MGSSAGVIAAFMSASRSCVPWNHALSTHWPEEQLWCWYTGGLGLKKGTRDPSKPHRGRGAGAAITPRQDLGQQRAAPCAGCACLAEPLCSGHPSQRGGTRASTAPLHRQPRGTPRDSHVLLRAEVLLIPSAGKQNKWWDTAHPHNLPGTQTEPIRDQTCRDLEPLQHQGSTVSPRKVWSVSASTQKGSSVFALHAHQFQALLNLHFLMDFENKRPISLIIVLYSYTATLTFCISVVF